MSRLLVKYRALLFALMSVLVIASALAVPHINVISDVTRYMPDDYAMKQGLELMEEQLPALHKQMLESGTLFSDGSDLLPSDLPQTLAIGSGLLFLVLLVMCSSFMEVVLFLLTTGYAVVLNMGTNSLLPGVSMITNVLTPVLQMVLSMDYCIIMMNRYRQEKASGKAPQAAMQGAVGGAASSILSSAFTTIVSLLMLCFIKLKIGADLGIVLSKGVAFSLICNFTVLPFLIVAGDKAVEATRKRVPLFPAGRVSRFAYKFRYPLTAFFVAVFVGFAFLQHGTPFSFAPKFENSMAAQEKKQNAALLIYPNSLEGAVPALMDSIVALPGVRQGISYPSLIDRPRTAEQMSALFNEFAPAQASSLPSDMLSLVYYARFHRERTERLSFREMMDLADELAQHGMVPEGFDYKLDMDALLQDSEPAPVQQAPPVAVVDTMTAVARVDTMLVAPADSVVAQTPGHVTEQSKSSPYTYAEASKEYTASGMAAFLKYNERQISMLYRLAGKKNGTMTPQEFFSFVRKKILTDKRYAAFVSDDMKTQMTVTQAQIDSVIAAGPAPVQVPVVIDTLLLQESIAKADSMVSVPSVEVPVVPAEVAQAPEPQKVSLPPTPIEVLADMAFSSVRYTSSRIYSALNAAGVSVPREQLDLLFLYSGARKGVDSTLKMTPGELLDFVADTLFTDPSFSAFVPDSARTMVSEARQELLAGVGQLRGEAYSGAVIISDYPVESDSTYAFVDRLRSLTNDFLPGQHYWIGESEMYKEFKEGFPREFLLLTLLTILSIFIIVAITFRSIFIPIPLIITTLSGVYVNIWASGLGGDSMFYLSCLIIQCILMGATIDYTILYTQYYQTARRNLVPVPDALTQASRGSSHSILTSGLILVIVPYVLSLVMKEPMIASILRSLSFGALAIVTLILFVLPGVVATLDPLMKPRVKNK